MSTARHDRPSPVLRAMLVFTVAARHRLPAGRSPAIGQVALPRQANGSLVPLGGKVVGSALIGQSFTDARATRCRSGSSPAPRRPATATTAARRAAPTSGPRTRTSIAAIARAPRRRSSRLDGVDAARSRRRGDRIRLRARPAHPPGVRAAAGRAGRRRRAGSAAAAVRDAGRVARSRHRDLGYLGEPRVNVLELNIALGAR